MLHECLVIDNSNFFKNGTIRVRIKTFVLDSSSMMDMSLDPGESINYFANLRYELDRTGAKVLKYDDEDVLVASPMGTAFDYGLFYIPQINTRGIVAELGSPNEDDAKYKFVWVGGLYQMNEITKDINIPSSNMDIMNGYNRGSSNIENISDITFKQKETRIIDSVEKIYTDKTRESLDWNLRPTQNMIVMSKDKVTILHNNHDEEGNLIGSTKLELSNEGGDILFKDADDKISTELNISNDGSFRLSNDDTENKVFNDISSDETGISLNREKNGSTMGINLGDSYSGGGAININIKDKSDKVPTEILLESGNGITINSNSNISINPGPNGDITLGSGEGYILTSQSPGTWNFDNHVVTAVKNAKA